MVIRDGRIAFVGSKDEAQTFLGTVTNEADVAFISQLDKEGELY